MRLFAKTENSSLKITRFKAVMADLKAMRGNIGSLNPSKSLSRIYVNIPLRISPMNF